MDAGGADAQGRAEAQFRRIRDDLLVELNLLETDLAADERHWAEPTRRLYRNVRADWSRSHLEMGRIIDALHQGASAPTGPPG